MAPPSGGSLFRFSEQTVNKDELVKTQFLVLKELRRVTNNEARLDYLVKCKVHKSYLVSYPSSNFQKLRHTDQRRS